MNISRSKRTNVECERKLMEWKPQWSMLPLSFSPPSFSFFGRLNCFSLLLCLSLFRSILQNLLLCSRLGSYEKFSEIETARQELETIHIVLSELSRQNFVHCVEQGCLLERMQRRSSMFYLSSHNSSEFLGPFFL